jgi:hypothetical protein
MLILHKNSINRVQKSFLICNKTLDNIPMKMFLLLLLSLSIHIQLLNGQTATDGDYRTRTTGNWNGTSTWQVRTSAAWANTSVAPTTSSNIYIQSGHTLTVNVALVDSKNININNGGVISIGANNLRVSGKIRAYNGAANVIAGTDGTFYSAQSNSTTPANTIITSTSGVGRLSFIGNTRSITVSGEFGYAAIRFDLFISFSQNQSANAYTVISAANINVASGTLSMNNFDLCPDVGLNNSGTLTISDGAVLQMGTGYLKRFSTNNSAFASFTINGNGFFRTANISAFMWPIDVVTSFSAGSTVELYGSSTQTIPHAVYGNLTLSGASTKTSAANSTININTKLSIQGAAVFALGSASILVYGTAATLEFRGTSSQSTGTGAPMWPVTNGPSSIIINNSYGVTLNATGGRTVTKDLLLYHGTFTLTSFLKMANDSKITRNSSDAILSGAPVFGNAATDRVSVTVNGKFASSNELKGTVGKVGTLTIGITSRYALIAASQCDDLVLSTFGILADSGFVLTVFGNITGTGSHTGLGKILMSGANKTVSGISLSNVEMSNSAGFTLSGSATILGTLTFTSGTLSIGANTLTIQKLIAGTRTNLLAGTTSSLTISGDAAGIIIPSSVTILKNLSVSNTTGVSTEGNIAITNGTANITGFLILGNHNMTQSGISSFTGAGTLQFNGALATQIGSYNVNTFQPSSTYIFNGTSQSVPAGTYGGITINGGGSSLIGDITVNGTIALNGILTVGANNLTIYSPITITPTKLITDQTSGLTVNGYLPNVHIPSSVSQLSNLTINNSNITSADGNIRVRNLYTQSNGFLNLGVNILEIGQSAIITGDIVRTGGAVRGAIKRWFANTTTSDKIFPLDNGFGAYSQAKISFTGAPSTGGSLTAIFHNSGSGLLPIGPNGTNRYIVASELHINIVNIAPQYWSILSGDGLTGGIYNLDLTGDAIPNVLDLRYVTLIKRINSVNPWAWLNTNYSATTGSNLNPVLHIKSGTSFSDFGVGGNTDNLLPIELASFTSSVIENDVTLNWTTNFEQNNSGFDIERKSTALNWVKIGNIAGHGTINTPSDYTFDDRNLSAGKFDYRLKQIDFNGNTKYYVSTNQVVIGTPGNYVLSQNFPNPFNPSTTISYELPKSNFVSLKVYDMMGKEVANLVNQTQDAGFYSVLFNASDFASGIYFYKIQAADFSATKKLMLVK